MLQISQRPLSGSDADARLFVDRKEETGAALRALGLGFNLLVLGDPKSGRTSFLRHVERRATSEGRRTAFVDAQAHPGPASLVEGLRGALGGESPGATVPGATLTESDLANMASPPEGPATVFVDNLSPGTAQTLFGRFRDVLWQFEHQWVVSGLLVRRSEYLEPPADSFFDSIIELGPLNEEDARALLEIRIALAGASDDARQLEGLIDRIVKATSERTPGVLLALTREVLLHGGDESRLQELAELGRRARALGRSHAMLFSELETLAPVHAGDERLLQRLGYTRSRIVQMLKDLEGAGVVESRREGRRQLYYLNPGAERAR
jgi:DNA-binding transcriptional ArsR family regulator